MADMITKTEASRDDDPRSTPAIISYILLAIFAMGCVGVFAIIFTRTPVDSVMLGVLGALVTSMVGGPAVVGGFWLASSVGSSKNSAAIRQLAGAGPPPPADPSALNPAAPENPDAPSDLARVDRPPNPAPVEGPGPQLGGGRPAE